MLAIHGKFTRQMCDSLKITGMGLGLVRLLQDARRFKQARTTLYLLESGSKGVADKSVKPSRKASKTHVTKTAFCSSGSASTGIKDAEMRPYSLSIA